MHSLLSFAGACLQSLRTALLLACVLVAQVACGQGEAKLHDGPAWLDLTSGTIDNYDGPSKPRGPIVLGEVKDTRFVASHAVLYFGRPTSEKPEGSTPGWIELNSGKIHRDFEAVKPIPPYLHGWVVTRDGSREFVVNGAELKQWSAGKKD